MRILLILGIPVLAIAAAIAMMGLREEPPKKERVDLDPLVDVIVLEARTTNFEVRSQGTIRPKTETILSAEVSGTISSISPKFVAGGVFKANEILMRIDPTNYKVAVDQAEALVAQRQIEYDGARKLRSQGYRAEAEYASAVAALASAKAEHVRSKKNLQRTYIRLPYEGIVRSKESDLGQFVNPGTRLGVTFATDIAEVRLPLTDLDLAFVNLPEAIDVAEAGGADGPAVVLFAMRKGQATEWPATIVRTEGVVDEKSRVTYAVARVVDPYRLHSKGPALPMGTFVSARIKGAAVSGLFRIPNSAVRGGNELLFVDADNTLRIRQVDIIRSDSEYSYFRGANEGELAVTSALEAPIDGMALRTSADDDGSSKIATTEIGDEG
ncbi:MAG: efflux RND transporter periplasmic adaptor subunit [Gammaproteobacteria bacterium]|nr:efflux RND transporter periplasmic adaptor subunit [Gammaproteobacteria bacterium]MBU2678565.1 efflux RND transporter periplasmic adaptor subunit [Gammaproteobacteria bacterium]NNC57531.1 efflux RND transporter periplasmic adaptor subunit [Woeseiaceae bacterium]NNL52299.1 efflux RND transporter periplasmic adaptor subunit [Woeseiaceae bacterium]